MPTVQTFQSLGRGRQLGLKGRPLSRLIKRTIDVVLSAGLLLATLPVFALVGLAIKLESPGPVFYRARRVGYRFRPLYMLKFRKMRDDAAGSALTADDDPRFTRMGAWLCKTKLDELPQLWNVLRGDMSLIGPRPEDPSFVDLHLTAYSEILRVRPGITGCSQIAFADECRVLDDLDPIAHYLGRILPQKVALDVMYATQHCGPRRDAGIMFWTLVAVVGRRQVAVDRRTGRMNIRHRPRPPASSSSLEPIWPAEARAPGA